MPKAPRWTEDQYAAHKKRGPGSPAKKKVKKKNKFNATKVADPENPGVQIDSKREARHLQELRAAFRGGAFDMLATQVLFRLGSSEAGAGTYKADFVTGKLQDDNSILLTIMDSKGFATPLYRRSKAQMKDKFKIEIIEL